MLNFKDDKIKQGFSSIAEALRQAAGNAPFEQMITSAMRSPDENAAVGGVPNSFHTSGNAIDLRTMGKSPEEIDQMKSYYQEQGFQPILEKDHLHVEPFGSPKELAMQPPQTPNLGMGANNLGSQGAQPYGQDPVGNDPEAMKFQFGLDHDSLKKQKNAHMFSAIMNGLAGVVGSLNPNNGRELQKVYMGQGNKIADDYANRQKSAIAEFMKLQKGGDLMTNNVKEYKYAQQDPNFTNFLKEKASLNPLEMMRADMAQQKFLMDQEKYSRDKARDERGQRLPATQAVLLADGNNIPAVLDKLETTLQSNQNIGGPIAGRISSLNPYDTETQNVQSEVNAAKQFVAKFLEGGVLRKEDEEKYDRILPTMTDTPEVRMAKLNNLRRLTRDKQNEYINSFNKSGYDVSEYMNQTEASAIQKAMSGGQNQQMSAEDQEAIAWAKQNPNDPRAAQIMQSLGAQ
jgi:uncharacterized protein YcbK (DUF882 family)